MGWSHRQWGLLATGIIAMEAIGSFIYLRDASAGAFLFGAAVAGHGIHHDQERYQWVGLAILGLATAATFSSLGTFFLPLVLGLAVLMGLQRAEKSEGKLEPPEGVIPPDS